MNTDFNNMKKNTPLALALLTCATLLLEISLTRIFSITMWYHFGFMAISVAMFGMAFGSVVVYLKPQWFKQEVIHTTLAKLALLFSLSTVLTFWLHINVPFIPSLDFIGILSVLSTFVIITIPFMLSGIAVSVVLTRFSKDIGKLYAFDLIGAAIGCLLVWLLMKPLTGPGVIFAVAAIGAFSSFMFVIGEENKKLKKIAGAFLVLFALLALIQPHYRVFTIHWVKNSVGGSEVQKVEREPLVEKWNSHSCVTVFNTDHTAVMGWGLSPVFKQEKVPKQLFLLIDAAAGTVITEYNNNPSTVKHLKYDVTALAHHLRPESDVLIIGTGGGRDILTSLQFNPKSVTGVEINADILELINEEIGDFTGHLDRNPKVNFYNDEARSWIERSNKKFDIIQASLIDSWAATSAGAFVLTENSLYTEEAWTEFLQHLSPRGVLTMSRWWVRDQPGEMLRATSLAYAALRNIGIENPRKHVLIATTDFDKDSDNPNGVGTIIVSKTPFTASDVKSFVYTCNSMKFKVLLSPNTAEFESFASVLDPQKNKSFIDGYPINISPSTDDNPFFFNMLRFSDLFSTKQLDQWVTSFNMLAVTILGSLFVLVVVMSFVGLFLPLMLHERKLRKAGQKAVKWTVTGRHSLYFGAIGLAFILVEIGQIQRLTLFLGHPVYSLVIVLFSLLLATGIGASLTGKYILSKPDFSKLARIVIFSLVIISLLAAFALPYLLDVFHGVQLWPRFLASIAILSTMGVLMGAAFPIGLNIADREIPHMTPWLWAINGALSVVGSVLAMILSIGWSITITCTVGAFCYLIAFVALNSNLKANRY